MQTLVGHSGMVRCLHLAGNRIVSGAADNTIKVSKLIMLLIYAVYKTKNIVNIHT